MGMTIDEIILKEKEIAEEFQRTVDTHMVSEDMSLEEMYCDDTEVIEETLKRRKELLNYHNTIADIMLKYQKIEEIVNHWACCGNPTDSMIGISEILEDGNEHI